MTYQRSHFQRLKQQLKQDCHNIQLLTQVLEQEQQALAKLDTNALTQLSQQKINALETIEANTKHYWEILSLTAGEDMNAAIQDVIANAVAPFKADLSALWEQYKVLLQQARQLNEINGAVVDISIHNHKRLTQLLMGRDENQTVYGAQGQTESLEKFSGHTEV